MEGRKDRRRQGRTERRGEGKRRKNHTGTFSLYFKP